MLTKVLCLSLCLFTPALAKPDLLPVPLTRQSTTYSCGAGALQALLGYYGLDYRERELMDRLHTNPKEGTPPEAIVRVCRQLGFKATLRQRVKLEDLGKELKQGRPVIIDAQAWRDGPELKLPWSKVWESGHYMVAIGLDEAFVYFADPSLLGSRGRIPRQEFLTRWHDYENGPRGKRRIYWQAAIFVSGRKPNPPADLQTVQ